MIAGTRRRYSASRAEVALAVPGGLRLRARPAGSPPPGPCGAPTSAARSSMRARSLATRSSMKATGVRVGARGTPPACSARRAPRWRWPRRPRTPWPGRRPACSASTSASASAWLSACTTALTASFMVAPAPRSPRWNTLAPEHVQHRPGPRPARPASPPTMKVSSPRCTTGTLPLTGASSRVAPAAATSGTQLADGGRGDVLVSSDHRARRQPGGQAVRSVVDGRGTRRRRPARPRPYGPRRPPPGPWPPAPRRSRRPAPDRARGVRFHTVTANPAPASRAAIAPPIRPPPIRPRTGLARSLAAASRRRRQVLRR